MTAVGATVPPVPYGQGGGVTRGVQEIVLKGWRLYLSFWQTPCLSDVDSGRRRIAERHDAGVSPAAEACGQDEPQAEAV